MLAVVPGDRRVDLHAIRTLFAARYIGFCDAATAEQLAHAVPGTGLSFSFDPGLELVAVPAAGPGAAAPGAAAAHSSDSAGRRTERPTANLHQGGERGQRNGPLRQRAPRRRIGAGTLAVLHKPLDEGLFESVLVIVEQYPQQPLLRSQRAGPKTI